MIEINLYKFNPKKYFLGLVSFWTNHWKKVFYFFMVLLLGISVYVWYRNIYNFQWSEDQKIIYQNQQRKEVNFNESDFNSVLESIGNRKRQFHGDNGTEGGDVPD